MLSINHLTAVRGENTLFQQLSFIVQPGDLVQVEGRNGTGKTTLLRMISGLAMPESGEIRWNNEPIAAIRELYHQQLLFLGHLTGVKSELTALENVHFYQSLHGSSFLSKEQLYSVLARVGLAGREDIPVSRLSAGQQRRVALARLWLSSSPLWILDEPLTAIDKQGVAVLASLFLKHTQNGGMIIFTTHQDMFGASDTVRKIKLGVH